MSLRSSSTGALFAPRQLTALPVITGFLALVEGDAVVAALMICLSYLWLYVLSMRRGGDRQ